MKGKSSCTCLSPPDPGGSRAFPEVHGHTPAGDFWLDLGQEFPRVAELWSRLPRGVVGPPWGDFERAAEEEPEQHLGADLAAKRCWAGHPPRLLPNQIFEGLFHPILL